jgi:diaminohydroxyphosphoribosylaminopyrimidine deaminase/5-amino-6-(5-phosphoribosylamino)uracil reductase
MKRPYVILKWAETKDGFIYPGITKDNSKKPIWISNEYSRQMVHKWRTEDQAFLVGTTTAIKDNPSLTARNYYGKSPIRIAIDKDLNIPEKYHFYDGTCQTIIFTNRRSSYPKVKNLHFVELDFTKNTNNQILKYLFKIGVQSIIIEGGAKTLQSFIDSNLWDEARVFVGNNNFKIGIYSPDFTGKIVSSRNILKDVLSVYENEKPK